MIKAILFDMDGVLIDAAEWHYIALNKSLELFGYSINRYEHLEIYNGLPTKLKLKMLSKEKGLPVGLHSFINEMKQAYTKKVIVEKCAPVFCHEYALATLKKDGFKLGVCTNSIRDSLDLMLDSAHISEYFDLTMSCQECSKPKPDPEIYTNAISKLELDPKEVLIVEDSHHGIKAAEESGAHVLVVRNTLDVNIDNINRRLQELS